MPDSLSNSRFCCHSRPAFAFLIGILLFVGLQVKDSLAQPEVLNPLYRFMVEGLYEHSVPVIGIAKADSIRDHSVLLDTREKQEFNISHIPGAVHVGYVYFDTSLVLELPRDTVCIVYCSVGYRSEKIGEFMQKAGFQNVFNLYGGAFEWVNQGYPLVRPGGTPTDSIHGYSRTWGIWVNKGKKVYEPEPTGR